MNDFTSLQTQAADQQQSQGVQNASSDADQAVFLALSQYPFDTDAEYLMGLSTILGHPSASPSSSELAQNSDLVLQAKCFYFSRKHGHDPVDPLSYRQWLQSRSSGPAVGSDAAGQTSNLSATAPSFEPSSKSADGDERPPYPTSFAAIVDLITRNAPVPGIEEIPPTVLDHGTSKVDHTPRRKKPWESEVEETVAVEAPAESTQGQMPDETTENYVNGELATGEGVVKILQPSAIPESGLLSK